MLIEIPLFETAYGQTATNEKTQNWPSSIFDSKIDIAGISAAAAVVVTLVYSTKQIKRSEEHFREQSKKSEEQSRANEKVANAQFWLALRNYLSRYDTEVAYNLRPGGK